MLKSCLSVILAVLLLCTGCAKEARPAADEISASEATTPVMEAPPVPQQVLDFEAVLPIDELFGFPTYYINSYMDGDQLTVIVRDPRESELNFMKSLPGGADAHYINVSYSMSDLLTLQEILHRHDQGNALGSGISNGRLHITLALNRYTNQETIRALLAPYFLPEDESMTDELRHLALPIVFEGDPSLVTLSELDALQTQNDTPANFPHTAELYMTPAKAIYPKGTTELEAVWTVPDCSVEYTTGAPYEVEKYIDGQWRMIGGGGSWTMEAYTPTTGFTSTFRFTNVYYDTDGLTPGHYRAVKTAFPSEDYRAKFSVYCYFEVK